jgi:catalase-peroxidase
VPFAPGRTDATQEQTDVASFAVLEPTADGFRNYLRPGHWKLSRPELLVDKASLLTLTAPEMTVLVGGLRVLNANFGQSKARRLHQAARHADQRLLRQPARHEHRSGRSPPVRRRLRGPRPQDRRTKWTAPASTSSSAPTPSSAPSPRSTPPPTRKEKFVHDFVAAWTKVMNLDRFDLFVQLAENLGESWTKCQGTTSVVPKMQQKERGLQPLRDAFRKESVPVPQS